MLQFIRDRATGWIAWGIVILISIPFALWGIQQYLSPDPTVVVAKVNGVEIPYPRFQESYSRTRSQLLSLLGPTGRADLIDDERIRRQTLEQLVEEEVLRQEAERMGMRVGDAQVAVAIQSQPAFLEDGVFSQARYEDWLRGQGLTPAGFEQELRRSMLLEQIRAAVARSATPSRGDLERLVRIERQRRTVRELRIPASRFADQEVSEEDVAERYQERKERYFAPERVKLSYVELSRTRLAESIPIDDEELRAVYESRKQEFTTPEQREARHILIRVAPDASEDDVAAARARIESLRAQLEAGADFAELARANSEDPGSASQGGALGAFGRGVMDPAFEAAAFSLAEGVISEPVRSAFGFHLIQVTRIDPGHVKPFAEVKEQVRRDEQRRRAEQLFYERADRLANLAFEHPDSLEPAAEALGVEPATTGFLARDPRQNPPGLGREPKVLEVAFSPDVLTEGNNSDLIDIGPDRVVVLRVLEHREAAPLPLEEVRDRIREEIAAERAREAAARLGERLLSTLAGGADPQAVAAEAGSAWSEPIELRRDASDGAEVSREVRERVFRMPRSEGGASAVDGLSADGGDYVLVRLESVADGDWEGLADDERDGLRQSLAASLGNAEYRAYVDALRAAAEVEIYERELR